MSRGRINFTAANKLRKIINQNKPDIIQGWMYHGNLAALLGSIMTKKDIKLSWTIRLSLEIFKSMKLSTRIAIRLGSYLSRIPDLIIYNSTRSLYQHRHSGFSEKKDFFIPNGFDTKAWKPDTRIRLSLRKSLGISKASTIIGYVGRGDDQKDIPTLFKAFEIVSKKHQNIFLVTIGRNLKKYPINNKNIIFLGKCENMLEIYKTMDIVVLPSWREGLSKSLLEAAAMELPIITTNVPGCRDIIKDKYSGLVVAPKNENELKLAIKNYLENPNLAIQYGKNARKTILEKFNLQLINRKILSIYEEFNFKKK